jgi:Mrp family chromosome partitioning ATPase/capsular polysaccharide biosynthesis protein
MTARQPSVRDDFATEPRSIDLRDYWLIVRRRWLLVAALTVIGVLGGFGYAHSVAPSYTATSQVVVMPLTQGPLNSSSQGNLQVNMSTEQAVAQSPLVVAETAGLLHVDPAVLQAAAAKRLTVSVPANTLTTSDVLEISWEAGSPRAAQAGADAFAQAYLSSRHHELANQIASLESTLNAQVASIQKQTAHLTAQLSGTSSTSSAYQNLTIRINELTAEANTADSQLSSLSTYDDSGGTFVAAALPLAPSGLGHKVILVIGALLGLLLGLTLAFVRDSFDDRVRDSAQLERKLGATTLAVLTRVDNAPRTGQVGRGRRSLPEIITAARPSSRAAESIRALRATLVAVAGGRDLRTFLVACADGSISSSRIAAELGVALAESGRRVLVVAADMRGSSLPRLFDLPNEAGLSDVLRDDSDPKVFIRQPRQASGVILPGAITKRLSVLPSGPPAEHALAILDSGVMLGLLQSQRDAYDFVVLDSPPATVAADVISLAAQVDGVIVLAREARTSGRAVEDLRRRLDQVGALLIGGVFIAKGNAGRPRHRAAGRPSVMKKPAAAATERTPNGPQPDPAQPDPAQPDPAPPEDTQSDDTRPLRGLSGDGKLIPPGGLAKQLL